MEETPFGRYRLLDLLGRGPTGEVWRARDTVGEQVVALKLLPAALSADPDFEQRFRREVHAAAGLNEPHIVPIHHFGEIDGRLYVDMELIEGGNLETAIAGQPMEPLRAVGIVAQIASALSGAHLTGLAHGDVKTSNILLADDDFGYLTDFGMADAAGDFAASTDVYALTSVLYECLTGMAPVAGGYDGAATRPSDIVPELPGGFNDVVATGMAADPSERYPTATALAEAAMSALTTPAAPTSSRTQPIRRPQRGVSASQPRRAGTPNRQWLALAAVCGGVLLVGLVYAFVSATSSDPEPASTRTTKTGWSSTVSSSTSISTSSSSSTTIRVSPSAPMSVPTSATFIAPAPPRPPVGEATDEPFRFVLDGIDTVDTIASTTIEGVEAKAEDVFVVVRLDVTNTSPEAATLYLTRPTLSVGGETIRRDSEAILYANGSVNVTVAPGATTSVAIVFDAPASTQAESIRVYGTLTSDGVDLVLK